MDKLYFIKRCPLCSGVGLTKRNTCFTCSSCKKYNTPKCCLCENASFRGIYTECTKCWGAGEIYIDRKTNKHTIVPLVTKETLSTIISQ